jgi:flagellar basal body-associated protein FliL
MLRTSRRAGKLILIIVLVVALIAGVGAGAFMLGPKLAARGEAAKAQEAEEETTEDQPESKEAASHKPDKSKAAKGKKKGKKGEEETSHPQVVALGEFLVNVQAPSGLRYLRAEVSLSLLGLEEPKGGGHGGGKPAALPEADLAVARDCVVSVLSASSLEQLQRPEGRVGVKQRLQAALGKALSEYQVEDVLFTSFVMQ